MISAYEKHGNFALRNIARELYHFKIVFLGFHLTDIAVDDKQVRLLAKVSAHLNRFFKLVMHVRHVINIDIILLFNGLKVKLRSLGRCKFRKISLSVY